MSTLNQINVEGVLYDIEDTGARNDLKNKATIQDMTNYIEEHKEELKGDKGEQGEQGEKGQDGTNGVDGKDGKDGYTPVKGVDYFTDGDKQQIKNDIVSSVVVQKAGESESLVMSQKAVTEALGNKLDVSAPIDPSWEKWDDIRYNYGFDKNTQPIFNSVRGTLESDTMISVRGGKGRWGWHNFEAWSPNELSRLTMLMGKHHETFGYIQTFSPNGLYADRNRWGWVKVGCDELNEGTDFSKNWTTCYTPITLAPQTAPNSVADYDLNPQLTSNAVPVGTMYFDEEEQRIKIYTKTGWQPIAFVGEGGGGSGGEEEFYEPIPSYRNGYYVEVETSKIVSAGSNGRLAAFRLNKNTNYTVTRSALSARFRIYLYYNTSLDDAIEKGAVGTLIAQDSSHTSLSTLSFTNTDFAMAVVMLSNKGDTTTTITAEIIE